MQKKSSIIGIFALVILGAAFGRFAMIKHQAAQRFAERKSSLISYQQSKEWQQRAALFNRNKVNAAAIFNGATKVEGVSWISIPARTSANEIVTVPKPILQDSQFAKRLGAIILDEKNYPWPGQSTKSCYFDPAVKFRIWKNKQFVDAQICFHCSQLVVFENDSKIPSSNFGGSAEGRYVVAGDFDVVRPELLALTKEAFPDDNVIQAIR